MEDKEACVEQGTCMEGNRSLLQSLEGWEREPGRLRCCFIYTPVYQIEGTLERVGEVE